jgi:hypothetical protein
MVAIVYFERTVVNGGQSRSAGGLYQQSVLVEKPGTGIHRLAIRHPHIPDRPLP